MPYKAKRPCAYQGCPRLTHGYYCDEHQSLVDEQRKAYYREHRHESDREYERTRRDPTTARRYNRTWRVIRNKYIRAHPLCEECLRLGRAVPAEHVHHIIPLADGGTSDASNLMSLCKECHSRIHMEMRKRGGRGSANL